MPVVNQIAAGYRPSARGLCRLVPIRFDKTAASEAEAVAAVVALILIRAWVIRRGRKRSASSAHVEGTGFPYVA
jgi:hypothetical protein